MLCLMLVRWLSLPKPESYMPFEKLRDVMMTAPTEFPEMPDPSEGVGNYMYILSCSDGSFYTGSTTNLRLRLEQHKSGEGAEYTKDLRPVKLIYCELYDRIEEAFAREKQVQGWSRKKKIALIKGNVGELKHLAQTFKPPEIGPRAVPPSGP